MARRAREDFLTVTELADTLVRRASLSFREAHRAVAEAVKAAGADDDPASVARALLRVRPEVGLTPEEIAEALDPARFVRLRKVIGGPAPERTQEFLERARASQREVEEWVAAKRAALDKASGAGLASGHPLARKL
jgi:argininosuccinate lyase